VIEPDFDPLVPRPIDRPTVLPLTGDPDPDVADRAKIFAAPDDPADWPAWRAQLHRWRESAKSRFPQADRCRSAPDRLWKSSGGWASRCYCTAIVWLWDERLFDHTVQRFTPQRLLDAAAAHGGFDAVVLWHAYPIIGIDDRNQFDYYRDVPGLAGLIAELRDAGVRVLLDYNPWDTGTRREPLDDPAALAELVSTLGADGVYLDTLREGGAALVAALRQLRPQPVLEGESRVPLERIGYHEMSWAQWFADSPAPGVMAARWFDRRHQQHHTRRWNRDHSDELQSAWMNGAGIVVWDAVFGSWVGWNERDRSTLHRMLRIQRALADVLIEGEWTPLVDASSTALAAGVYTSRFEHGATTLWPAVNRGEHDFAGRLLDVGGSRAATWIDLATGRPLDSSDAAVVVPARSIGGVLRVVGEVDASLDGLIAGLASETQSADARFPVRLPVRVPAPRSTATPPPDVVVLEPGSYTLDVRYRVRETGMFGGAPFVEEWKPLPPRLHADAVEEHTVTLGHVAVACTEVTGSDGAPLTRLTLAEARAHAAALGARLPTDFEWQLAAGDPAFRRTEPLVWNWTESEHSDGITRFVILKGGGHYLAGGSDWYFDGGPRPPEFSAKLLLAGLRVEGSPSIGFRLAWDLDP
jgi:sulfatase-modifying factor enzyme 1